MKPFEVNETTTGQELSSQYSFRQTIKLFPLTCLLAGSAFIYTTNTLNFIPYLRFDIISWVILIAVSWYSERRMNSEFEQYIQCRKLGKPMDWSSVLFYGWTLFVTKTIIIYWMALFFWVMFYIECPKEVLEQLYNVTLETSEAP